MFDTRENASTMLAIASLTDGGVGSFGDVGGMGGGGVRGNRGVANPVLSDIIVQSWWIGTHSIFGLNERIVHGNDLDIAVLDSVAEDNAANAAEAIDANLDNHCEAWYRLFVARELAAERTNL